MQEIDAQKTKQRQVQRSSDCRGCFRTGWARASVQARQYQPDRPEMPAEQIEIRDHVSSNAEWHPQQHETPLLKGKVQAEQGQNKHDAYRKGGSLGFEPDHMPINP